MAFSLDRIVPWGRSFGEYVRMFSLSQNDLTRRVLGCADGPASFNAEANSRGINVVSVDPLYSFSAEEVRNQIKKVCPQVLEQTRQNQHDFIWREFASIEALGRARLRAMARFLADYSKASSCVRYLAGDLRRFPFGDGAFELALCSHFLFLYSDQLGEQFHVDAVLELCRVADEVRIFPLLSLGNIRSAHLHAVTSAVEQLGRTARIEKVRYEFQ